MNKVSDNIIPLDNDSLADKVTTIIVVNSVNNYDRIKFLREIDYTNYHVNYLNYGVTKWYEVNRD